MKLNGLWPLPDLLHQEQSEQGGQIGHKGCDARRRKATKMCNEEACKLILKNTAEKALEHLADIDPDQRTIALQMRATARLVLKELKANKQLAGSAS